ncbi:DUF389 domain-containing protein [Saccharopolyspora gloriosae]|uniref:DUF389 domain-containing protein n=1 Tax=Saccharopolyspora gloriosae TaxID=455344 RepID=UPI001FB709F0|nr:DUF389 domain-containing protein [Saccharopolyspora gloriosae]
MLHLRIVSPPERTDQVLAVLREQRGTAHLCLFPQAALEPAGDVIEVDVAREAADDVLAGIGADELAEVGAVQLTDGGTLLSEQGKQAEWSAPGDASDAVVWDDLIARTGEESRLSGTFAAFLSLACLLAAVGVVTDSEVTVVGAMVLGPEFGPLAAIVVGVTRRRWELVRQAVLALVVGFPVAMVLTVGATMLGQALGLLSAGSLADNEHVAFVYQVGWASLIVSLLAGAAGMLSLTSAKSGALVGVFISVTTVPAAGYAAVAATLGAWDRFFASTAQLAVNLTGIVLAASVVLLMRSPRRRTGDSNAPIV